MSQKLFVILLISGVFMLSCSSSNKFQASTSEDKPLFTAINELNKRPGNVKAQSDLKSYYQNSVRHHQEMIEGFSGSNDPARHDKILRELNALQNIYTSLQATPGSFSLVKPKNYQNEIQQVHETAAAEYYDLGMSFMRRNDRESSFEAYNAFKNSNRFIKGYRDTDRLIKETYERSVINIVINPIRDNNIMFSRFDSWGNDFRYRPEDYQMSLARDLSSRNGNEIPARFLTDREADRKRVNPDYEINLTWRNLDGYRDYPSRYTRRVSNRIPVGSDTSGHPIYQNVYATLQITRSTFQVRGDLEYQVANLHDNSNVDYGTVSNEVQWDDSYATYSGDSRALSPEDWALVNNGRASQNPTRGDIMNELMRRMYPELRNRIERAIE